MVLTISLHRFRVDSIVNEGESSGKDVGGCRGDGVGSSGKGVDDSRGDGLGSSGEGVDGSRGEELGSSGEGVEQRTAQLNADQRRCFDDIVNAVTNDSRNAHFFLQGADGTGKTFLYRTLCNHFSAQGKIVLCVPPQSRIMPDFENSYFSSSPSPIWPWDCMHQVVASISPDVGYVLLDALTSARYDEPAPHRHFSLLDSRVLAHL